MFGQRRDFYFLESVHLWLVSPVAAVRITIIHLAIITRDVFLITCDCSQMVVFANWHCE